MRQPLAGEDADPPALTVRELIAALELLDPDLPVWTATGPEYERVPARSVSVDNFGWGLFVELDEYQPKGDYPVAVAPRIPLEGVIADPAVAQRMLGAG